MKRYLPVLLAALAAGTPFVCNAEPLAPECQKYFAKFDKKTSKPEWAELTNCLIMEAEFLRLFQAEIEKGRKDGEPPKTLKAETLQRPGESATTSRPFRGDINIDEQLRLEHARYEKLKVWYKAALAEQRRQLQSGSTVKKADPAGKIFEKPQPVPQSRSNAPSVEEAAQRFEDMQTTLHGVMDERHLREIFAAQLVSGVIIGDTGSAGSGGKSNPDVKVSSSNVNNASASAHLVWESSHFFAEEHWVDVSFGGKFGFQPAMTLVQENVPSTSTTKASESKTAAEPQFQQAFVWNIAPRLNIHTGERAEFTIAPMLGQVRLNSQTQLIEDKNGGGTLAFPINDTGKSELYYDYGISFKIFDNPLHVIHEEQGQLSPVFDAGIGFRRDDRFKRAGLLTDFDHPQNRFYFRFMVNGLKVIDRRPEGKNAKPFSVDFGVEYDQHWLGSASGIPSATRIVLRGNLDLLKALQSH